jgi:thiol-disulfide isomerase/thioredoxin
LPFTGEPELSNRPALFPSRRSLLATLAALTAASALGKSARADELPDASDALTRIMPQSAPAVSFTTPHGKMLGPANYAGHTLVLNFWATWCGPCVEELPSLAQAAPGWARHGILVLPVSIDLNGAAAVIPFYKSHDITTLPILLNSDGSDVRQLNAPGIPATLVINAQGQLVAHLVGAANWNTQATFAYLASLGATPKTGIAPISGAFL